MRIASDLLEQIIAHARRDAPVECCGFVTLQDGRAVEVIPVANIADSPLRFEVGPADLLRLAEIDDGDRQAVIYHSHTRSPAVPSQTDVNFAANWPGVDWLIVGVAQEQPDIRTWRIEDGQVTQVEVTVDGAA
jgi:[CysO sulfur-carrier protein]-S-L-cysteine hydrolase